MKLLASPFHSAALLALVLSGLPASTQAAVVISFSPSAQAVDVGDIATVDLVVSGLGNGAAPSLGAWAVTFDYDPSIVSISMGGITFGSLLDLPPFGSDTSLSTAGGGNVSLFEVSFADALDLDAAQPDSFTLATLNFSALAPGSSPLSVTFVDLSDEVGRHLDAGAQNGVIRVRGGEVTVPEPAVGVLPLALVWGGALIIRRRLRRPSAA
jgi:hypothetical protein